MIDRHRPLRFMFDGKEYTGYGGDTLAAALLAAGVKLFGRSFKYHRPRGVFTAGSEEPNALVELRTGARREPNTRATTTELFQGLEAASQNRWPSLAFDIGAVNSLLSPLFVAGFYYKTFMWPAAFWEKLYEPLIRRAAGLGRAAMAPDPDGYEHIYGFCDVLVIGAGPGGLSAALSAARAGARVTLCDEDFMLGGRLLRDRREVDGIPGAAWAQRVESELNALPNVRILRRTTVFGVYDGCTFGAIERLTDHLPASDGPRQRLWHIVAKTSLLAAGAIERPIVFGGNDRPGVMMASAVRTYVNRFGVAPGRRAALFTTTDDGWTTAADLNAAGIAVEAIIDTRSDIQPRLLARSRALSTRVLLGATVVGTRSRVGRHQLSALTIREADGRQTELEVDLLATSGGWNPTVALTTHLGGRPRWSTDLSAFVPGDVLPPGMSVLGAAAGTFALSATLREGHNAGVSAAGRLGIRGTPFSPARADDEYAGSAAFWYVPGSAGKAFVDLQHDVTSEDISLAAREGFRSAELLKRYTTLGMATDQGKTSNINGLAILAALTERTVPEVGTTVYRPPYVPVPIGAFAGPHRGKEFQPTRLPASHAWAQQRGAEFVEVGQWLRARWFAVSGETDWSQTVAREVRSVRSSAGVCDVSTLGKIDVQGADAGKFLDLVYINTMSSLAVGKVRYGLMLREDGIALDDGTAARLGADHFIVSTTTVNAGKVLQHLEHASQVLFPDFDVQLASVTDQWAQYAIAGPHSRTVLRRLLGDVFDVSNESFPYLACAEFVWRDMPVRLFRVSFSGELAYELAVPSRQGDKVMRAIMAAGADVGITPYGTEALSVMRIEKGHVAGNELNGMTTARDLGFGRLASTNKDYIGRVLATRPGLADPDRPALIGLRPVDGHSRLHAGAHFLDLRAPATLENDRGYLTSVAFSPMLKSWIGLGFLAGGPARVGERVRAVDPVRALDLEVEVVAPPFYDRDGLRLRS
jgi:methylglutamate dehydrogenase subunit C